MITFPPYTPALSGVNNTPLDEPVGVDDWKGIHTTTNNKSKHDTNTRYKDISSSSGVSSRPAYGGDCVADTPSSASSNSAVYCVSGDISVRDSNPNAKSPPDRPVREDGGRRVAGAGGCNDGMYGIGSL